MMGTLLQGVIAAMVRIVANVAVREVRQPAFEPRVDDEELLSEVRRDRAPRSGGERER